MIENITLRDLFAVFSPEPKEQNVVSELERDRRFNPHNDHYKPSLRSTLEIECELRYKWADMMMKKRSDEYRYKDI